MANMNISGRSQSLPSLLTTTKVSAPKAPTQSAPSAPSTPTANPAAFPSTKPSQASETQEVESSLIRASSSDLRRNATLVSPELRSSVMSDLDSQAADTPALLEPVKLFAKTMDSFLKKLRPRLTELPIDDKGDLCPGVTAKDTLMMRHNPHATPAAKQESELFRAFACKEYSNENCDFLDAAVQLSKLSPTSPEFDQQLDHIYHEYVKANAPSQINLPSFKCRSSTEAYQALEQAREAYRVAPSRQSEEQLYTARECLMECMTKNVSEIDALLKDTWGRYTGTSDHFRVDNLRHQAKGPFRYFIDRGLAKEARAKAIEISEKKSGQAKPGEVKFHVEQRLKTKKENGQFYADYKKTLANPHWKADEQRILQQKVQASGARVGSIKFKLYDTFIAPWKTWG